MDTMKKKDMIGQQYGRLTVVERTKNREERYVCWKCKCDCGREIFVNTRRLKRGTVSDCGCIMQTTSRRGPKAEELDGRTFGELLVQQRISSDKGRTRWLCRCSCGNEIEAVSRNLKSGVTNNCGCKRYQRKGRIADLSGQRFGRLVVDYPTDKRDKKSSVIWFCSCDCGQQVDVSADRLLYGSYRSCGCLKKESQQTIFEKLHFVDGTCIEWLEKRKERSDNTSGFRGVYLMKNGTYRAGIGLRGQRFHLGVYKHFEEAVAARIAAETVLHDGFIKAYYQWKEQADKDSDWRDKNPFHFKVKKMEHGFVIL